MFLATASTKRPIAMTCLLIALLGMGLNAFRKMSLEDMPAVDIPYITVVTTWLGASSEDIEKDISKHIEDAVSGVDGLKHISSSSLENVSQVTLEFNMGVNVDTAAQDVRERIDMTLTKLPSDADRPVIQKINLNASAIANIFLSGDSDIDELYEYADTRIADRFASVGGVAEVQVIGGNEREIWVELDSGKLAAAGLTSLDVVSALQGGVMSMPAGRVREGGDEYAVRFDAEYANVADIGSLEVANNGGARLKLRDLGSVREATQEIRQRSVLDGRQGILIKVIKKAEGNIVSVVKETRKRFDDIRAELPGGMELTWVSDESANIRDSVNSAMSSIGQAILICAFILLLFLANWRTTLVVSTTMPVTVVISIFFMQLFNQTLNTVTLLALGLSTGVLVSNSIVVLENIVSKFETNGDKWESARAGASEVAVSILASAGTNVIVMLPVALMSSIAGKMLAPFALTTLIVNAVSIFISFTLTPILCVITLRAGTGTSQRLSARISRKWDSGFSRLARKYSSFMRLLSSRPLLNAIICLGFVVLFLASMKQFGGKLGFSFFENADRGRMFIRVEFPPFYDLAKTQVRIEGIQSRLLELPDIEHVITTAGKAESTSGQANEGVYMGQIELFFKQKTERAWKMNDLLNDVRKMLADETDCIISASVPGMMGGQSFMIDYTVQGDDLGVLESVSQEIRNQALGMPKVSMLETTVRDTKPEVKVKPKRAILSDMRLPVSTLGMLVRANIDGVEAASYRRGDRTYDIRVKLAEAEGKDQIRQYMLRGTSGRPIPLESVADVEESRSMLQIFRVDKQRSVKLLGDITPGATMSEVGAEIERVAKDVLPPGYTIEAGGVNEMMGETVLDFLEAILLGAFLTILTLCAILESWSRPALVLLTLPMALIGVLGALVMTGNAITIFVLLGGLMLIGIVVNAAILIVDKAGQLIKGGMERREAMIAALEDQFRPVLMIILASGLGMLPIALSTGIGSENRCGMGVASVGGIIVSGALTMMVLPLFYTLFVKRKNDVT